MNTAANNPRQNKTVPKSSGNSLTNRPPEPQVSVDNATKALPFA
jgi:hypothetical protein